MLKISRFLLRIPTDLYIKLRKIAHKEMTSTNYLIIKAVSEWLEKNKGVK